jgi:hypothetical protein
MPQGQSSRAIAILLIGVLLASVFVLLAATNTDPLAPYRNADGSITITGGVDSNLLNALFSRPPAYRTITVWYIAQGSFYPTAEWDFYSYEERNWAVGISSEEASTKVWDAPEFPVNPYPVFKQVWNGAEAVYGSILDGLRYIVSLDWLIGTAGARIATWDGGGGDGLWGTAANWDGPDILPVAGDDVVFDGTSSTAVSVDIATPSLTSLSINTGYGNTITVNIAQTASWGVVTFGAGTTGTLNTNGFAVIFGSLAMNDGTLTAGASSITVNGNWDTSAGVFNRGTSNLTFGANGTLRGGTNALYILTMNGKTVTVPINLSVFQIKTGAANSTLIVDTSIDAVPITITFDDAVDAGFREDINQQRTVFRFLGNATNGVTVRSVNAPPTNGWTISGRWGLGDIDLTYVTFLDFITNTIFAKAVSLSPDPGWVTMSNVTFQSTTSTIIMQMSNLVRIIDSTWDRVDVGGALTNKTNYIFSPAFLNGATVSPIATAGQGLLAVEDYAGTANDYRFWFGNTAGTATGALSNLQVADRPSSADNVTWGGGISTEDGTMDVTGTIWNTLVIGASTTLILSGGASLDVNSGGLAVDTGKTVIAGSSTVTITGNITVGSTGYIDLGSSTWTVTGTWTNDTTSASWNAGTSAITFNSATGGTMTFAGTNLAEDEFYNVTFESSAGTAQTFTMATRGLRLAGTLTISDTSGTTEFDTGSQAGISAGAITVGAGGILTGTNQTITVSGNFDSSAGTFAYDTSTLVFAANGTLTLAAASGSPPANVYNLTVNASVTVTEGANLPRVATGGTATINGTLTGGANYLDINVNGTPASPLVVGAGTDLSTLRITLWAVGSGTFGVNIPSITVTHLVIIGFDFLGTGTFTLTGDLTTTGVLYIGEMGSLTGNLIFDTSTNNYSVTVGTILDLGPTSGTAVSSFIANGSIISVGTDVDLSKTVNYIIFGSSTWTVSGAWINPSKSASWDAGTSTVTFDSATGGTMTFAGSNLPVAEFYNVTFTSSASSAQPFTMSTRGLRASGTLTIEDSSGTTTLNTSNLNIQANSVQVLTGGILLIGTGDLTSIVTLNVDGSMTMDTIVIDNILIQTNTGTITITVWTAWAVTPDVDVQWTFSPSASGAEITVTLEGAAADTSYDLQRNSTVIDTQTSSGTGTLTFAVSGGWATGDIMLITITPPAEGAGGGGGGGGGPSFGDVAWVWRHQSEDLTIQFKVTSPTAAYTYQWFLGDQLIGEGSIIVYTFDRSGTYTILLKTTVNESNIIETPGEVTAKTFSFLGQYLLVLLLLVIAVWYVVLVLADVLPSDSGRLFGMGVAMIAFATAIWLFDTPYTTIRLNGQDAITLYVGLGLISSAGVVRSRLIGLIVLLTGFTIFFRVYSVLIGG